MEQKTEFPSPTDPLEIILGRLTEMEHRWYNEFRPGRAIQIENQITIIRKEIKSILGLMEVIKPVPRHDTFVGLWETLKKQVSIWRMVRKYNKKNNQ